MVSARATLGRRGMVRMLAGKPRTGRGRDGDARAHAGCYAHAGRSLVFDRLISGAGAITDAADRLVRALARDGAGTFTRRPGSLLVAAGLVVAAVVLAAIGIEASGGQTLQTVDAGAIAATDTGRSRYVTVEGDLATGYIETFNDADADGEQDPGETGDAWYYYIVDPDTHEGVTVRSDRHPNVTYSETVSGIVVDDPAYVAEDIGLLGADLSSAGITLDTDEVHRCHASRPPVPRSMTSRPICRPTGRRSPSPGPGATST